MKTSRIVWRNTARPVRFFFFDARVLIAFVAFFLHISWITFYISTIGAIVFSILERFRITPFAALRYIHTFIFADVREVGSRYLLRRNCRW